VKAAAPLVSCDEGRCIPRLLPLSPRNSAVAGNARRLQDGYETDCSTGTSRLHGKFSICHQIGRPGASTSSASIASAFAWAHGSRPACRSRRPRRRRSPEMFPIMLPKVRGSIASPGGEFTPCVALGRGGDTATQLTPTRRAARSRPRRATARRQNGANPVAWAESQNTPLDAGGGGGGNGAPRYLPPRLAFRMNSAPPRRPQKSDDGS
jgi:hypothetical protein